MAQCAKLWRELKLTRYNFRFTFKDSRFECTRKSIYTGLSHRCSAKNEKPNTKELLENAATFSDKEPKSPEDVWETSPYPKGALPRSQANSSFRPRVDPRETSIIVFPGQGTQFVGMGKNLLKFPSVQDMFAAANHILKFNLLKLCTEGPKDKLDRTEYSQLAILVCSLAALERLKEEQPSAIENCIATAGFSLGEITALVFAEVISFERALQLVKARGQAMQIASEMTPSAMLSVIYGADSKVGLACVKAREHAASLGVEKPFCGVSNYLFPSGKILAGNEEAIQYLEKNKDEFKLRRLKRLPVSGAFHTPLMLPALEPFKAALHKAKLSDPAIAVHSNVDGKHYQSANHVLKQLPKQMLAPVKWEQTLHALYERPQDVPFPKTFECGPGKSLSTILKAVNAKAWDSCVNVGV